MKVLLLAVGRIRPPLRDACLEYERRVAHYFRFETVEVREETARDADSARVRRAEGERLLARVPEGVDTVALHRAGELWSSRRLAEYLDALAVRGAAGAAFLIGGAFGLADECLERATHVLSLSGFTLPHELARLVLTEQLYRAGTICRGEPYHKERTR